MQKKILIQDKVIKQPIVISQQHYNLLDNKSNYDILDNDYKDVTVKKADNIIVEEINPNDYKELGKQQFAKELLKDERKRDNANKRRKKKN